MPTLTWLTKGLKLVGASALLFASIHPSSWSNCAKSKSGDAEPDGHLRAANELTITAWDPASKQPLYKVGAVRITKISDSGGTPAPAPTTTASAPATDDTVPATVGGEDAEVVETVDKEV